MLIVFSCYISIIKAITMEKHEIQKTEENAVMS